MRKSFYKVFCYVRNLIKQVSEPIQKKIVENRKLLKLGDLEILYSDDLKRKECDTLCDIVVKYLDVPHSGETTTVSFEFFKEMFKIMQSKNHLEIGHNRGFSSLLSLLCSDANVTSIDLVYKSKSVSTLKMIFGDRFDFVQMNSLDIPLRKDWIGKFDSCFVDGSHERAYLWDDINNCLALNPKWLILDDWSHPGHKNDYRELANEKKDKMILVKEYANGPFSHALFLVVPE